MFADNTSQIIQQRGQRQFELTLMRRRLGQAWATLTGLRHTLAELKTVASGKRASGRYAGLSMVPANAIGGSEKRNRNFDAEFNPLTNNTQERWLSIFTSAANLNHGGL